MHTSGSASCARIAIGSFAAHACPLQWWCHHHCIWNRQNRPPQQLPIGKGCDIVSNEADNLHRCDKLRHKPITVNNCSNPRQDFVFGAAAAVQVQCTTAAANTQTLEHSFEIFQVCSSLEDPRFCGFLVCDVASGWSGRRCRPKFNPVLNDGRQRLDVDRFCEHLVNAVRFKLRQVFSEGVSCAADDASTACSSR